MLENQESKHFQSPKPQLQLKQNSTRFFILFLLIMVIFGNQYAFNNPQALQQSIKHKLQISQAQYDMLYTIFSLPNIASTVILGYLIDYIGVRIGIIFLIICVTFSQIIVALGGMNESYATMLVGRMIFGIAAESLVTAQACFVSYWFTGKELAFALGLAITMPELGNALNSYLSPIFYQKTHNLGYPLFVSVGICLISTFCAIWAVLIDVKVSKKKQSQNASAIQNFESVQQKENSTSENSQTLQLSDLKLLKSHFWLLVLMCMFSITCYVCFMDNAGELLQTRFCYTQITAGKATMITYIVAACVSAPLGLLVDKIGRRRFFIMMGIAIFALAHFVILIYPNCENSEIPLQNFNGVSWGLLLVGLGYCFYANCLVPSIPLIVPKKVTGTAFGIMQMVQSLSLSIFPLLIGKMIEHADTQTLGYKYSSRFYFGVGIIGVIVSFQLFWVKKSVKRKLDAINKNFEDMNILQKNNSELKMSFEEETSKQSELKILKLANMDGEIVSQTNSGSSNELKNRNM